MKGLGQTTCSTGGDDFAEQALSPSSTGDHEEKAIAKVMEPHRRCDSPKNSEISILYKIERRTNPRKGTCGAKV